MGLLRQIDLWIHLGLDVAAGLLLAVSPWLFGFADHVWGPHVIIGAVEVATALTIRTTPAPAPPPPAPGERHAIWGA